MSFAHPAVLLLLLLIPLLAGLKIWGGMRSRRAAAKVAAARLLPGLLIARGKWRTWVVFLLEMAAIACFVIALARPQYGYLEEEAGAGGRSLIVAIDTSKSMLADDLKPSRLQRAQLAASDLIRRLRGDRIGLMPFAGNAFMYAPITPDTDALLESIDSLDTEIIPRSGSNLARPIDLALETFAKIGADGQQVLILFSDGESLEGETQAAAKRALEKKMTVICIGVGTQSGGTIPDPDAPGGYHRDRDGKVVVTRLERQGLVSIANTTRGLYLPLDGNGVNDGRVDAILSKIERSAMKGKITKKAIDRYRWPLGAGLILLLASWIAGITRRHFFQRHPQLPPSLPAAATTVLAAVLTLVFPGSSKAAPAGAPEIKVGNPWEFYRQGDYKSAQGNFEKRLEAETAGESPSSAAAPDPALAFGRGAAAFKNKDYDTAVDAFGTAVLAKDLKIRAQAHYNLANSIYQRTADLVKKAKPATRGKLSFVDGLIRQLENSLENYQQSLTLDPGNADTKTNHNTTDDLIQKLRNLRKQLAKQQGQGKGKGKKKKGQKGQGEQGEGQPGGEGEGEGGNGKSGPNGQQQGPGNRKPGDEGENGDEEGDGANGEEEGDEGPGGEGEQEKEAREKSNQDRQGDIGAAGGGPKPGDEGEGGDGDKNSDQKSDRNPGGDADGNGGNQFGNGGSDAENLLDQYSDEDTKVRPRLDSVPEARPRKDW
ncbi:MAG: VWA domain-containing protein [Verrucomicrobiota bacterium]